MLAVNIMIILVFGCLCAFSFELLEDVIEVIASGGRGVDLK
jgi:hypothetical protein